MGYLGTKPANALATTDQIGDGAVQTSDIANNAVTNAKIADASITTSKISDGNVTVAKLSTGSAGTGVGFVRDVQQGWLGSASFGYVIFQAPNGTKVAQCWGTTSFNGSGVASITFPITFSQAPNVTASVYRGSTLGGYMMSTQIGSTTTTGVTIIGNYTTGGSVTNLTGNEAAAWIATGPVA